jgi:hypothetical protein
VDEQIPLLAVHDAYAVRKRGGEATYAQMKLNWDRMLMEANFDEFLENTEYTVQRLLDRKRTY